MLKKWNCKLGRTEKMWRQILSRAIGQQYNQKRNDWLIGFEK